MSNDYEPKLIFKLHTFYFFKGDKEWTTYKELHPLQWQICLRIPEWNSPLLRQMIVRW